MLQAVVEMEVAAKARGVDLLLPCDVVVARTWEDDKGCCTVPLTTTCCSKEKPCVPEGESICAGVGGGGLGARHGGGGDRGTSHQPAAVKKSHVYLKEPGVFHYIMCKNAVGKV